MAVVRPRGHANRIFTLTRAGEAFATVDDDVAPTHGLARSPHLASSPPVANGAGRLTAVAHGHGWAAPGSASAAWQSAPYGGRITPSPRRGAPDREVLLRDSRGQSLRLIADGFTVDEAMPPPTRRRAALSLRLRLHRLEGQMKNDETTPPLRERAVRVPPPAPGVAIATMGDDDLEQLRRALAHALGHVRLGTPPSALLGRLSHQTRAEQRRRARERALLPKAG